MNYIRKSSISSIVNCNDDHKNLILLAGVTQLLEAAQFLERQEKVEAFKIKSKSDATINFESTQTIVNDPKVNHDYESGIISTGCANPQSIFPETELGPDYPQKQFDRLNYLYRNISSHGPFFCKVDGCDKEFKRKDNLKCHLKTHIPNRSRPFECQKCNRGYLRHVDLSRHIETVHLGVRKHFCQVCNKSFTRKEGLRIHSERCA
jgi:uncharacterized Zn-finger protein